jgi:transcriptional regulator GlxA family with amidase domain
MPIDAGPSNPSESRRMRVVVLLLPSVHILDLAGPVQAFYEANGFGARYDVTYCATAPRMRTAQGLVLADLAPLPEISSNDLVVVPGMDSSTLHSLAHVPSAWLREAHGKGADVTSVCSGAFALGVAGLLDGRACTTHWKVAERLQTLNPAARVVKNRLYVRDGNVVTSAGVAAGIDMALSLIEEHHGPLVVAQVAREMVVYLRREGEREQASVYLNYRTHLHPGVHRVQDWVIAHPEQKPTLAGLADLSGMSPRTLSRAFRRATGITPKAFANRVKVQVARDLLRTPGVSVEAVAAGCGFEDARQLRRLWKQNFGVTLSEWRRDEGVQRGSLSCP